MNTTTVGTKIDIEFTMNTSPSLLFSRLSTPSGLSEWFADNVSIQGNIYTFIWNKTEQKAEMVSHKENKSVRFRWLYRGDTDEAYFEFRILQHELTGDLALHVTEVIANDEADDAISLWNYQIGKLKRNLGI